MEALQTLYKEGGVARLYQGLPLAIIQGPLSRFGDTAANALVLTLWSTADQSWAHDVPLWIQTGSGSLAAGLWRIFLMPIDTYKTTLQVHGPAGWSMVNTNVKRDGLSVLYNGALAASAATVVGHFPWFLTYNFLSSHLPSVDDISQLTGASADVKGLLDLSRTAFIGLCASSLSDTSSNALRVLKTTKQTQPDRSYLQAAQIIIAEDGVLGLFGRGLQVYFMSHCILSWCVICLICVLLALVHSDENCIQRNSGCTLLSSVQIFSRTFRLLLNQHSPSVDHVWLVCFWLVCQDAPSCSLK